MKYASIDIGTNTVLLLIVENGGRLTDVLDASTITRLGEGLKARKRLSDEAMERTFSAIERYRKVIDGHGVEEIVCVGTSALREAGNSNEFLSMVREKLGITIKVISERDEAYYTYLSVRDDRQINGETFIILDIGGGSTEIIKGGRIGAFDYISLPVGSVKLTEMFIKHDPPLQGELTGLSDYARGLLRLPFDGQTSLLVGTGGTVTNLASIVLGLEAYDKDKIHGLRITLDEIDSLAQTMKNMSVSERRAIKGMEQGREDIILQGIVLLREIMVYFSFPSLTVSAKGVRYGVIYEKFRGTA